MNSFHKNLQNFINSEINSAKAVAELEPVPIVPNQEKQIKLLIDIVNKQSEMVNMQSRMVQKQSEMVQKQSDLIELIRQDSISSKKESRRAMIISILALSITTLEFLIPYVVEFVRYFY